MWGNLIKVSYADRGGAVTSSPTQGRTGTFIIDRFGPSYAGEQRTSDFGGVRVHVGARHEDPR